MAREESVQSLRQALATAVRSGAGRAFPSELRERAAAHVRRRRREGASETTISRELGIGAMTFRRWVGPRTAFAEAIVVDTTSTSTSTMTGAARIVVHGPRGIRIEGLELAEVIALVGALS